MWWKPRKIQCFSGGFYPLWWRGFNWLDLSAVSWGAGWLGSLHVWSDNQNIVDHARALLAKTSMLQDFEHSDLWERVQCWWKQLRLPFWRLVWSPQCESWSPSWIDQSATSFAFWTSLERLHSIPWTVAGSREATGFFSAGSCTSWRTAKKWLITGSEWTGRITCTELFRAKPGAPGCRAKGAARWERFIFWESRTIVSKGLCTTSRLDFWCGF